MEQLTETEKLKLRIHELQSMMQHRDTAIRVEDNQKSEGDHALIGKYLQELSTLQETVCNLERTVLTKDSQIKVLSRDEAEHMSQIASFKG